MNQVNCVWREEDLSKEELKERIDNTLNAFETKKIQKWLYDYLMKDLKQLIDRYADMEADEQLKNDAEYQEALAKKKEVEEKIDEVKELLEELRNSNRDYMNQVEGKKCTVKNQVKNDMLEGVRIDIIRRVI